MTIISKHSVLAILVAVALLGVSPAYAQSVEQQEKNQMNNSAAPDVLPDSSQTGPSQSIPQQEQNQMNNSAAPDVLPDSSQTGPSQSITTQEKNQMK
ncbi:hypothetical protein [Hyphomicrobium facile]|uniref:Uncharacterized protein n=1 Tax=Hyphomicrobium facile TaxID=51670 RepID=A0A1I7NVW1_9HYPH|nr:hypothetical protein [Hyphomicrobium facile]SFV38754.1 hypothetical protein SAMN04488557_3833 [Hyphomicrobium facile]